mgnify:CR=1 FL=1|tara:strand:+ start:6802 stop:7077 length:276 start_codon:yes stop_codon:yes gene_type:complete
MTVKELMERIGIADEGFSIAYINDAVREIQNMIEDNVVREQTTNIVKDQRYYDLPTGMIKLLKVLIYDGDNEIYVQIPRTVQTLNDDKDNA